MKKIIVIFFILLNFSNIMAIENDFVEYTTSNNKYTTKIQKDIFNNYKYNIAFSMKKMINCQSYQKSFFNPIYGVEMHYNTIGKNKKNKCIIDINNNSLIHYRCAIEKNILSQIINSKIKDIKNNYRLEDINDYEEKIYNNSKYCKKTIIKKLPNQKEKAKQEIKNNPELQKMLQFFN